MAISCCGKKIPAMLLVAAVVLPAVLWVVWVGTASLFMNKGVVENILQNLSSELSKIGDENQQDVKLTYGNIEIGGWGYKKQATIGNVVIEVIGKNGSPMKFKFSTENVIVSLDQLNPKRLIVGMNKPVNFASAGYDIGKIEFSEPFLVSYIKTNVGGTESFNYDITLPKQIGMMPSLVKSASVGSSDEQGTKNYSYTINFPSNPALQYVSTPEQKSMNISYDFSGVAITSKDQSKITIGGFVFYLSEKKADDSEKIVGKYNLDIGDAVFEKAGHVTKPYTLVVNTDYIIDVPAENSKISEKNAIPQPENEYGVDGEADSNKSDITENRDVNVNRFLLSNSDFNLNISGKFSNLIGDPLPSGEVNVEIDDLQKFLASEIVATQNTNLVPSLFARITGKSIDGQTQVSFPIKRDKMGILYIGKTTFDELATSVLSSIMMSGPMSSPPMSAPDSFSPLDVPSSSEPSSSIMPDLYNQNSSNISSGDIGNGVDGHAPVSENGVSSGVLGSEGGSSSVSGVENK